MKVNLTLEQVKFIKECLKYSKYRIDNYDYKDVVIRQRMRDDFYNMYNSIKLLFQPTKEK